MPLAPPLRSGGALAINAFRLGDWKKPKPAPQIAMRMPMSSTCGCTGSKASDAIEAAIDSWRRVVVTATELGIPIPGFSSALSYYDALRRKRLPAALIQAQGLDALNQNLDSLAAVLRALGQGADPDQAVDPVALADLAARLRPAGDRAPTADPGDLILF